MLWEEADHFDRTAGAELEDIENLIEWFQDLPFYVEEYFPLLHDASREAALKRYAKTKHFI